VASTSGIRSGDLTNEVIRLRALARRNEQRFVRMKASRDRWRERARAAEWGQKHG